MKHKRLRTLKYILLGLNIVLAAVLAWIIVTQVRKSNEIKPAAQRVAADWTVLSDAVKEKTEPVITQAKEAVAAAKLEAEKKQAEAEAARLLHLRSVGMTPGSTRSSLQSIPAVRCCTALRQTGKASPLRSMPDTAHQAVSR